MSYGSAGNFPTSADSLTEWLDKINLSQHKSAFEGLSVDDLKKITDTRLKEIMPLDGHRRRLVLALGNLEPATARTAINHQPRATAPPTPKYNSWSLGGAAPEGPEADSPVGKRVRDQVSTSAGGTPKMNSTPSFRDADGTAPGPKYNSTASMYVDSTISSPDVEKIIFCVAIVLHDRIVEMTNAWNLEENHPEPTEIEELFTLFNRPLFGNVEEEGVLPTDEGLFQVIKSIYSVADFSSGCLVVALIYLERIRTSGGLPLLLCNWQPLLLCAMIVAQKVWDDQSLLNVDFAYMCHKYTLKEINLLEAKFLHMLDYDVSCSASIYTSYYFELRTLCEKSGADMAIKPLSEAEIKKLESQASKKTEMYGMAGGRKAKSSNY